MERRPIDYSLEDDEGLVERIRELCEQNAADQDIIEAIAQAFREAPEGSALSALLMDLADIDLQSALDLQASSIRDEIEAQVEAEYEAEFQRVEREYQSRATYDLIEEQFLSQPRFRDRVFSRIRRDLLESKEGGKVSPLFERALASCDEDAITSLILASHTPELIEKFREELVQKLLEAHELELRKEIKLQLSADEAYMKSLKNELIDEVTRRLFEEE